MSGIILSFLEKMKNPEFKIKDLGQNELEALKSVISELGMNEIDKNTSAGLPVKKQIVESQCDDGYCYLRFIASLPSLRMCSISDLELAITYMKNELGKNPYGRNLLSDLAIANFMMTGKDISEFDLNQFESNLGTQNGFIKSVMASKCAFQMKEEGAIRHIESVTWEDCGCEQIVCDHGYASRFMYCIMTQDNMRFGGESVINLDDLFTQLNPVNNIMPPTPEQSPTFDHVKSKRQTGVNHVDLQSKIDDQNNIIERLNQQLRDGLQQKVNNSDVESILPSDSSSQIGRYNKHFLPDGTVYNVNPNGKTVLSMIEEQPTVLNTVNVINGFMKTTEIAKMENQSIKQIAPINGLANPFKNSRLNMLCHFNTSIGGFIQRSDLSLFDSMRLLLKYSAVTPSEELSYQIIIRTFDLEKRIIIANPFGLPFIEVGMHMSDDSLNKCFSLLNMEYEMLWFSEMKSLKVPDFHKSFDQYKDNKLTSNFRSKGGGSKQQGSTNSKRTKSLIGF